MLHEVDHVLELVGEDDGGQGFDVGVRVRAAQRTGRIGHDRVKHLTMVEWRREERIEIPGEEEPRDVPAGAGCFADEVIDGARHEHDDDGIAVDIGGVTERGCVERIETRIEHLLQRTQRRGIDG